MNIHDFIFGYVLGKQDGGSSVEVESLSVTENGEYSEEGVAYSPVTVNVPNSYSAGDEGKVVSNGALVAQGSDTVTQNGTVDTTLINSLAVNVSGGGGASNVITGNFTGESAGALSITLPYLGNGYPVAATIWLDEGVYNTSGTTYLSNMALVPLIHSIVKSVPGTAPTYSTTGAENEAGVQEAYSDNGGGNIYNAGANAGMMHFNIFTSNATSTATAVQICKFHSATSMELRIKSKTSAGYGFPVGVKYNYCIYYSE